MLHKRIVVGTIASGLVLGATALLAELPSNIGWIEIPNTRLRSVCAADQGFGSISGVEGCPAITADWSGAVLDTRRNRLVIWGGGHNGYYGNELYALNLNSQTVVRLTDPGLPKAPDDPCVETVAGGTQPNSRHTYDGLEYVPGADRLYAFGGSRACLNGYASDATWTFDFATSRWQQMNPAIRPDGDVGMLTGFDPVSGLVLMHNRVHLYSYDVVADRYTVLSQNSVALGWDMSATYDPQRKKFVIVGFNNATSAGAVYTYTVNVNAPGTANIQTLSTTGGSTIVGSIGPGLEYDPVSDRIIGWTERSPNVVYSLNLDTGQWTTTTYAGGPAPVGNGTYGRLRYSAESGVLVLANKVDDNMFALRLSNTVVTRPNAPSVLTAQ